MKKQFALLMLGFLAFGGNAQTVVPEMRYKDGVAVRKPIMNDSINVKGEKFNVKDLLKTPVSLVFENTDNKRISADAKGFVRFTKPSNSYALIPVSFQVMADRFVKAKVKVTSASRFEIYVDGDRKKSKESVEDSLGRAKNAEVELKMEPRVRYDIVVKLMAGTDEKEVPALKCELVKEAKDSSINIAVEARMKDRYSLFNTVYGTRVTSVSLSPNGKYLLTGYSNKYTPKRSYSFVELTDVKTGRVLLSESAGSRKLAWMPKSNLLYYTVNQKDGVDIRVLDPEVMQDKLLFANIPDSDFAWSPNEDYLLRTVKEEQAAEAGPVRRMASTVDRIPGNRSRTFIAKYDLKTGLEERLTFGSHTTFLQSISPDGKKIIYSSSRPNITERPFSLSSLYEVNLETLKVDTLFHDERFLGSADYSPDGKMLLLTAGPEAFGKIGMNCGNHPIPNSYDTQAYLLDLSSRKITPITKDFNPTVDSPFWNEGDGCIYTNTTNEDLKSIFRYSLKTGKWEKLYLEEDVINRFSISRNGSVAAYIGSGSNNAGRAYIYDVKKKTSRMYADPMKSILDDINLGKAEEWSFNTEDGTKIKGVICYPPNFDANKKYPLIVYYYGGTTPCTRTMEMYYSAQLFASRDYVVYVVNPSGTIGFGQEFSARHVNAWGKRTASEIIEGTKKFCAAHPFVNEKKIGCIGASYGGFMTMYLQTLTDIFSAAVSHAGISDVTSYWGEGYWGYGYNAVAAADSYPWSNPDLFTKQGALFNADKIHTPLLLVHGTVDTNVPVGESIQLYNALKILGRPAELVFVDGADHQVIDWDKRVKWHATIMSWFAKWLQDRPEWWNEQHPDRPGLN